MTEIRVHAGPLARALVAVTEERPVPHPVVTGGGHQMEPIPGDGVAEVGDVGPDTPTGATVIVRAAVRWRDELARLTSDGRGGR